MSDKRRDENIPRALIDRLRTCSLLNLPFVHNRNTIRDGKCLLLIMRNVDRRNADLLLHGADSRAHLDAQLCVKI